MTTKRKRGPGRPRLTHDRAKGSVLSVRLTPSERQKVELAARMGGGSPSEWAREVLVAGAPTLDHVRNRMMKERLASGEALDVSRCSRNADGDYVLEGLLRKKALADERHDRSGHDWCDAVEQVWIGSIGVQEVSGQVVASVTTRFYDCPGWKCIWLK